MNMRFFAAVAATAVLLAGCATTPDSPQATPTPRPRGDLPPPEAGTPFHDVALQG